MIQGAIFDLDGTLLDSMPMWDMLASRYLRSLGVTPRPDVDAVTRPMSMAQTARYFQQEYGVDLSAQAIMDGINAAAEHFYRTKVQAKPGAADFLADLCRHGVKMCVATATDRPLVEAALERCGLRPYFTGIFTCTEVGAGKDQPAIYREALRHLGTDKFATPVFEDALHALRTAAADGFLTVAVQDPSEPDPAALRALCSCYLPGYADTSTFWAFASSL